MRWIVAYTILNHSAFSGSRVAVALAGLELQASPFAIGLILSFYSLLPMFLSVAGGRWIDRVGLRQPMLIGTALLTLAIAVPFLAWDIGSLYLSSVTVGLGFMAFHICSQKAAGDTGGNSDRGPDGNSGGNSGGNSDGNSDGNSGGEERRKANFSLLAIGYSISGFVGPTMAGLSIDYLVTERPLDCWRCYRCWPGW